MADSVLQEQSAPYRIDENGIPIKPGYRKPFNSETAKIAAAKSVNARVSTKRALQMLKQIDDMLKSRKRGYKPHLDGKTKKVNRDSKDSGLAKSDTAISSGQIAPIHPSTGKPIL